MIKYTFYKSKNHSYTTLWTKQNRKAKMSFIAFCLLFGFLNPINGQSSFICKNINVPIAADGTASIFVHSLSADLPASDTITVEILNDIGGRIELFSDLTSEDTIRFEGCNYLDKELTARVYVGETYCDSKLTLEDFPPIGYGRKIELYYHQAISLINNKLPINSTNKIQFEQRCDRNISYNNIKSNPNEYFVNTWVDNIECDTTIRPSYAKIYYKEFAFIDKKGRRASKRDTICIRNYPKLRPEIIIIDQEDSIFCGAPEKSRTVMSFVNTVLDTATMTETCEIVPMVVERNGVLTVRNGFKGELDINVFIQRKDSLKSNCMEMNQYNFNIIQTCWEKETSIDPYRGLCGVDNPPTSNYDPLSKKCVFDIEMWLTKLDTSLPVISKSNRILQGKTNIHDCEPYLQLPRFKINDCTGVRKAYAYTPGGRKYELKNYGNNSWGLDNTKMEVNIQVGDTSILIIEAYDLCQNRAVYDTCRYTVWDDVRPTATTQKEFIIGLKSKVDWVPAETFNKGSSDNCGIAKVLARRQNWYKTCGVNICDGKTEGEVEEYYEEYYKWLKYDETVCSDVLLEAWDHEISYLCPEIDEHGNEIKPDQNSQLGGGWAEYVPFCCEDACGNAIVELLIMDYHCNWTKTWSTVIVEDKQPVKVDKELTSNISISCKSYTNNYKEIVENARALNHVDPNNTERIQAFDALNKAFGSYRKVWLDPVSGKLLDADKNPTTQKSITVNNQLCSCETKTRKVSKYNDHTGQFDWIYEKYEECAMVNAPITIKEGLVIVNCQANIFQDVWVNIDDCGNGYVDRRFILSSGCSEYSSEYGNGTKEIIQRIYVNNDCNLSIGMFDLPKAEVKTEICKLEYDADENFGGSLHPDIIGRPVYNFGNPCGKIGIGYDDEIYELKNNNDIDYKIVRTWFFADWCDTYEQDNWMNGNDVAFKWEQIIIVNEVEECVFDSIIVSGRITGINNKSLSDAYSILYDSENMLQKKQINSNNTYSLKIPSNTTRFIEAQKFNQPRIGIDVLDLITLQRHLLNKETITDYYSKIAADVNEDERINSFDLLNIKKMLLGKNSSTRYWKFLTKDSNEERINTKVFSENANIDFVGVKLGDIQQSNSLNRNSKETPIVIRNISFEEFQRVDAQLGLEHFSQIEGGQIQLEYDTNVLKLRDIKIGKNSIETQNYEIENGRIKLIIPQTDYKQISIEFESLNKGELVKNLKMINFDEFENIIVDEHLQPWNTYLKYTSEGNQTIILSQNRPNPFRDKTVFEFFNPKKEFIELCVYDITGRMVWSEKQSFEEGVNQIALTRNELNATGTLYFSLKTKQQKITKKIILLD